jgi:hypothetical protein
MSPRLEANDWDFTPVIDLIYSLSVNGEDQTHIKASTQHARSEVQVTPNATENGLEQATQLGNFDKIWRYLGQPLCVPPPAVPPEPLDGSDKALDILGGNVQSLLRRVKWRDAYEGGNLADNDELGGSEDLSGLNKTQRKKVRRRRRRHAEASELEEGKALPSGSENESEKETQAPRTLDSKGVIYQMLYGSKPKVETERLRLRNFPRAELPIDPASWAVVSPYPVKETITIHKSPPKESAYVVAAAKKTRLMKMLNETFIDERPYLSDISFIQQVSNTIITEEGIHVFVDASNVGPNYQTCSQSDTNDPPRF